MQAQVELDRALVKQSHKQYVVAQRNVTAVTEQVAQAQAEVKSYVAYVIPYAAISETSSNCWKLSVISVFSFSEWVVERPSMFSWIAA
jgi:hypothetical protein